MGTAGAPNDEQKAQSPQESASNHPRRAPSTLPPPDDHQAIADGYAVAPGVCALTLFRSGGASEFAPGSVSDAGHILDKDACPGGFWHNIEDAITPKPGCECQ